MSRFLDICAGVALFLVGAEYAFVFLIGLVVMPFFAEPLWRTELAMIAGVVAALAAFALLWSRRLGVAVGFIALVTLAVVLVWNRLILGHLYLDSSVFMFLSELAIVAALVWWRFVFVTNRPNQALQPTAGPCTASLSDE
jgi:hypothetical protein